MPLLRRLGLLGAVLATAAVWSGSAFAAAPAETALPEITGSRVVATVGDTLTASTGTWSNSPTSYAYQWQRCSASCADVAGATGSTYTVVAADAGATLDVVVTATNGSGSTRATSAATSTVLGLSLGTTHFLVHYQSDPSQASAITQTQAGDVAALAERAYAAELAAGYPAPLSDGSLGGDGRIDVYVVDLGSGSLLGSAVNDASTPQTSGYILLNGTEAADALTQHTIAHELFHLVQFAIWLPSNAADYWLLEGSAEWMGYRVDNFQGGPFELGQWDMSLNCRDPNDGNTAQPSSQCDLLDAYKEGGYSRWPFFEYLAERYGADFVESVFQQGAGGAGSATAALSAALAAKGSSLAGVFTDWTVANLTSSYSITQLQNVPPPVYGSPIPTGTLASINVTTPKGATQLTTGPPVTTSVAVNHLAARYVAIERGSPNAPDSPCYAASLAITVSPLPSNSRPYFWWSQKTSTGTNAQAAQPLAVSGGTATISVPWDTCSWNSTMGYLVLPNPTTDSDGADFHVSATLTVYPSTQATATPPPDPVSMWGTTTDASSYGSAPQIEVFGPQLIRLSPASTKIRLIVSSTDSGSLKAALGSVQLGSAKLRPGNNDVRFRIPKVTLSALRRTSAATNVLTLTPVSASGVAGTSVVRRVAIAAPPRPTR